MLKKTIKYTDYEGVEREEDFYFNLNKAEVMEMQLSTDGTLTRLIEKIIAEKNVPKLVEIFKDLILKSYGEKSLDGKRFIKNKELTEEFTQTEAYSNLFMELSTDADAAAAFVNGIIPSDLAVQAQNAQERLSVLEMTPTPKE
jgi:hypothetical protein